MVAILVEAVMLDVSGDCSVVSHSLFVEWREVLQGDCCTMSHKVSHLQTATWFSSWNAMNSSYCDCWHDSQETMDGMGCP